MVEFFLIVITSTLSINFLFLNPVDNQCCNVRIWGFSTVACRYIRNALIFWDTCFLGIYTRYYGMPKSLGYVYNGMPVNAGG